MSLASLLNQSATLEAPTTSDRYGNPGFGSPVSVRVRFEKVKKTIITAKGENEPIDGKVFMAATTQVQTDYRFTHQGIQYRVMAVSDIVDGRGAVRHFEVMVQIWR